MDSPTSRKDKIWFLRESNHNVTTHYQFNKGQDGHQTHSELLEELKKNTETSSVYDCTVEDVELRYSHILFFCEEH